MKFVLFFEKEAMLNDLPESIKLEMSFITAGDPECIAVIDAKDEYELVRFVRTGNSYLIFFSSMNMDNR